MRVYAYRSDIPQDVLHLTSTQSGYETSDRLFGLHWDFNLTDLSPLLASHPGLDPWKLNDHWCEDMEQPLRDAIDRFHWATRDPHDPKWAEWFPAGLVETYGKPKTEHHLVLLDSIAACCRTHPDWRLTCVG